MQNTPQPVDAFSYLHDAGLLFNMFTDNAPAALKYMNGNGPLPPGYANSGFSVWDATVYLPFYNDSHSIILLNVFIRLFSFGYAGVHLVWMNFLGWIGFCRIAKALFPDSNGNAHILFPFLIPQVLIWNSLVLKEPLLLFGLGFLILGLAQWQRGMSGVWKNLAVGVLTFVFIKTFLLILILPAMLAFVVAHYYRNIKAVYVFAAIFILTFLSAMALSLRIKLFDVPALLYGQQLNMYRFVVYSHAGSILKPIMLAPEWASFIRRIPESIGYALMQPLPWLYNIKLAWLVFAENCLVLLAFVYGLIRQHRELVKSPLRLMMLTGGLVILMVSGFVAPVAGSLIRYKMPGILLLMLSVFPHQHRSSAHTKHRPKSAV